MHWLIPRLNRFHRMRQEVEVAVSTTTTLHEELRGGFDVAIRREPASAAHQVRAQHQATPILAEADTLVASPAPLDKHAVRTPRDILGATRLATETRPRDWADWLAAAGLPHPTDRPPRGRPLLRHGPGGRRQARPRHRAPPHPRRPAPDRTAGGAVPCHRRSASGLRRPHPVRRRQDAVAARLPRLARQGRRRIPVGWRRLAARPAQLRPRITCASSVARLSVRLDRKSLTRR